ncbi:MAG: hypothetical protein NTV21_14495 [Planctomycetota bacterium]|nr:hypothetical protein [Planctomycetota bacterium]
MRRTYAPVASVRQGHAPITPEAARAAFKRAVGRRREVTVHGEARSQVTVRESGAVVSRCMFLHWRRAGWLVQVSHERGESRFMRGDYFEED